MPFTTLNELKTNITNWLGGRTDLTSYYDDWIRLFEYYLNSRLRLKRMESASNVTTSGGFINLATNLSTDFIGVKEVFRTSDNVPLEYKDRDWLLRNYKDTTGTAAFYTIQGSTLLVYPSQDTTFQVIFYRKILSLVDGGTGSDIYSLYPQLYLWGTLVEAHAFLADTEQYQMALMRREELIDMIEKVDHATVNNLTMQNAGVTP